MRELDYVIGAPNITLGPNELSIFDGEHVSDILGASGLPRGRVSIVNAHL